MKTLNDYTPAEIAIFEKIHRDLAAYNKKVAQGHEHALDKPLYTPEQTAEYSRYMELLTAKEMEDGD